MVKKGLLAVGAGLLLVGITVAVNAQVRIAVLPFQNLHGLVDYNELCYTLADSLAKALQQEQNQHFVVIHPDTVDLAVLEVNLNPDNPQFLSDRWIVAAKLGADKVITGTLNVRYGKVFVNVYVYDMKTKKAEFQLRNLYRSQKQYLALVGRIVPKLVKYFNQ